MPTFESFDPDGGQMTFDAPEVGQAPGSEFGGKAGADLGGLGGMPPAQTPGETPEMPPQPVMGATRGMGPAPGTQPLPGQAWDRQAPQPQQPMDIRPRQQTLNMTPEHHPEHYGGVMTVGGQQFHFGTGGHGMSSPPGSMQVTGFTDSVARATAGHSYQGDAFEIKPQYDPQLGRMREGVLIHQGRGNDPGHIATAGCFGIAANEWPQFEQVARQALARSGGRGTLTVDAHGNANLQPLGGDGQTPAGGGPGGQTPGGGGGDISDQYERDTGAAREALKEAVDAPLPPMPEHEPLQSYEQFRKQHNQGLLQGMQPVFIMAAGAAMILAASIGRRGGGGGMGAAAALQGLGGFVNGLHQGNKEAADRGLRQYENEMSLIIDRRREADATYKRKMEERNLTIQEKAQDLQIIAQSYRDPIAFRAAQEQRLQSIDKARDAHEEHIIKVQKGLLELKKLQKDTEFDESQLEAEKSDLHGEDYLKTQPPAVQNQARSIIQGRALFPSQYQQAKSPFARQVAAAVLQADPTFEAGKPLARIKTQAQYADMSNTKPGGQITALNTLAQHAESLSDQAEALNNFHSGPGSEWLNQGLKQWRTFSQDPRVSQFNATRQLVSDELFKLVKGGALGQAETERFEQNLDSANSPEQLHSTLSELVTLANGRVESLRTAWHSSMGDTPEPQALSNSQTSRIFDKITARQMGADLPQTMGAPPPAASTSPDIAKAQSYIAKGKDPEAVKQLLQKHGIDTSPLEATTGGAF